jgi:hypothetical protein
MRLWDRIGFTSQENEAAIALLSELDGLKASPTSSYRSMRSAATVYTIRKPCGKIDQLQ